MNRYETLAEALADRILNGFYRLDERLPSVRALSTEHEVSVGTVQQAYYLLEQRGLVRSRPKSGYYVRRPTMFDDAVLGSELSRSEASQSGPTPGIAAQRPVDVSQWNHVLDFMRMKANPAVRHLGDGSPAVDAPTLVPLSKALVTASRSADRRAFKYDSVLGVTPLRQEIARLLVDAGCRLSPDEIVITTGCHEALSAAIRAVCQPGDIVAVDSPSFHGLLQALNGMGVQALEIPTDARTGISLKALELALEQWPIKAIQLTPNCNNPLGYIMPESHKRQLIRLAQKYDVAIIEDDVYGELAYGFPRPVTIKSFDDDGRVLLCSSFSKSVAPGLRVGWIAPGRYLDRAVHFKYIATGSSAPAAQWAMADFLRSGAYAVHIRRVRTQYQHNRDTFVQWVRDVMPAGTQISLPDGGFILWVELPEVVDVVRLNRALLPEGIQVAVGSMFSASGKFRHCMRLNYASIDAEVQPALACVGRLATAMLAHEQALDQHDMASVE